MEVNTKTREVLWQKSAQTLLTKLIVNFTGRDKIPDFFAVKYHHINNSNVSPKNLFTVHTSLGNDAEAR